MAERSDGDGSRVLGAVPLTSADDPRRALDLLHGFGPVLAVKVYRLALDPAPAVPIIPCLDHEAMLHQHVAPHAAAYVQERESGEIHEVAVYPERRRIIVDTVSTWGECSPESHRRLLAYLAERAPDHAVAVTGPSGWRGERRVAAVCRAQVTLREVLLDPEMDRVRSDVEKLRTVSALMEKQSRVASWGVRTVTGPVLAAAGVLAFLAVGLLTDRLGQTAVALVRYGLVSLVGVVFLYYGLKAVQLTEMANRVWKRTAEYGLILGERRRIAGAGRAP